MQGPEPVGILDYFFLGVGGVAQIFVSVIAPPDGSESPQGRHECRTGDCVITIQNVGIGWPIDNVVFQLRLAKGKAGSARLRDGVVSIGGSFDVDAVLV